jgi:hypothetical protein
MPYCTVFNRKVIRYKSEQKKGNNGVDFGISGCFFISTKTDQNRVRFLSRNRLDLDQGDNNSPFQITSTVLITAPES